jgi:hypothetical protein
MSMATAAALSVLPNPRLAAALAQAHDYLLGRQCANGGFSFYRSDYLEEPNIHDTWHAMAALHQLSPGATRREDLIRFVVGHPISEQPYALYFRVRCLCLLASPDPEFAAVRAAVAALAVTVPARDRPEDLSDELHRLRLSLWLKRHFELAYPAAAIAHALLAEEHPGGGFGAPPNLLVTRQALAVLALCGELAGARTGTFVARLGTPDFGFRLTVDSRSPSLETACAGISVCRRLDFPIAHADDALAFILDCQTGDGGFARAPDALPDIALTHLALAGLTALVGPLSP